MSTRVSSPLSEWLDIDQATLIYPYSRRQFWTWLREGRFPAYRPTKRKTLLKRSDIEQFLESSRIDDMARGEIADTPF